MLCHFCQDFVFVPAEELDAQDAAAWSTRPEPVYEYKWGTTLISVHQPSRKALELSAGQGCRVCAMFWLHLFQYTGSVGMHCDSDHEIVPVFVAVAESTWHKEFESPIEGAYTMELHCGKQSASLRIYNPISDDVSTMLDVSCVLSSRSKEQHTPIGSAVDSHTGSDYNMDLVKTWIRDCQKKHGICNKGVLAQTPPLMPTRVIEIEPDGQARLTETMGMRAEYLTLSYCWGQGTRLLCTIGSGLYEQFKQKLPVDVTMPRTFRHALQVTRALGYRYIWIDALCIIQDDPEDVGKEMAMMGGIYRQSTLTIFADRGPNTDAGLFSKRDARHNKSCNVRMTLKRDSTYLRRCISIQHLNHYSLGFLRTRGWILQEEVLSGRSLTFKSKTVEWSCITTFASESHPFMDTLSSLDDQEEASKGMCHGTNQAMRLIVRHPDIFNKPPPFSSSVRRNHFDVWYEMVKDYSQRVLSVDSDKLLAVAGLASLMQQNYALTYVTGLWREDLRFGLCWYVTSRNVMFQKNGPRSITEKFPDYLAPTWSWASAHGMCVEFHRPRSDRSPEEGLQIVNVEVFHLPGAPATFGYIKFAKLSICTKMRQITLAPFGPRWKQTTRGGYDKEIHPRRVYTFDTLTRSCVGCAFLDSVKIHEDVLRRYQDRRINAHSYTKAEFTRSKPFGPRKSPYDEYECWCVPCHVELGLHGGCNIAALVLTQLNAEKQEYRRIGLMLVSGADWKTFLIGEDVHEDREIIHIL